MKSPNPNENKNSGGQKFKNRQPGEKRNRLKADSNQSNSNPSKGFDSKPSKPRDTRRNSEGFESNNASGFSNSRNENRSPRSGSDRGYNSRSGTDRNGSDRGGNSRGGSWSGGNKSSGSWSGSDRNSSTRGGSDRSSGGRGFNSRGDSDRSGFDRKEGRSGSFGNKGSYGNNRSSEGFNSKAGYGNRNSGEGFGGEEKKSRNTDRTGGDRGFNSRPGGDRGFNSRNGSDRSGPDRGGNSRGGSWGGGNKSSGSWGNSDKGFSNRSGGDRNTSDRGYGSKRESGSGDFGNKHPRSEGNRDRGGYGNNDSRGERFGDKGVFRGKTNAGGGFGDRGKFTNKDRSEGGNRRESGYSGGDSKPSRFGRDNNSFSGGSGKSFGKPEFGGKTDRGFSKSKSTKKKDNFQETPKGYKGSRRTLGKVQQQQEQSLLAGEDLVRLNRYIANSGICSRREADELISQGLVKVNGEVVTELGTKVRPHDTVKVEDKKVTPEKPIYILLNKPKGYITSTSDPDGRQTVLDLIDLPGKERIYPVGRLDRNTTGVLLLTNDGELSQKLMHPSFEIKKIYRATLDKRPTKEHMLAWVEGVELEDGWMTFEQIGWVEEGEENVLGVEIKSGRNRIVRRMFEHFGYDVTSLDRAMLGEFDKLKLGRGKWRFLTEKEMRYIERIKRMH